MVAAASFLMIYQNHLQTIATSSNLMEIVSMEASAGKKEMILYTFQ